MKITITRGECGKKLPKKTLFLQNCYKLFQLMMAKEFDPRLIPKFSGINHDPSIIKWTDKVELVSIMWGGKTKMCNLYAIDGRCISRLLEIEWEEKKRDLDAIKEAVFTAFVLDSLAAYTQFIKCPLHLGEMVDVFLADLKRISNYAKTCPVTFAYIFSNGRGEHFPIFSSSESHNERWLTWVCTNYNGHQNNMW